MERSERELNMLRIQAELEKEREARSMREHERQLQLLEMKSRQVSGAPPPSSRSVIKGPKLPPYEEGKDNIDSYLQRFERYATTQGWVKDSQWAPNLSVLLKGRALDVFSRLPVEQSLDYEVLKCALLKRFEMTEQGFRKRFIDGRPEKGETFSQFAVRLDSYFQRWLEMAGIEKSFEGLKDLMVRDQFLRACGTDLTLFLKERIPKSIGEMSKLADQYAEARGDASSLARPKYGGHKSTSSNTNQQGQSSKITDTGPKDKPNTGSVKHCYICQKTDHLSFNCPQKVSKKKNGANYVASKDKKKDGKSGVTQVKSVTKTADEDAHVTASCNETTEMPVVQGFVGNHPASVLRDSGCERCIVRTCLVRDEDRTSETETCVLANGQKVDVPVAYPVVDTPYFKGKVRAWCMDTPVYDLILGNIKGARKPYDPDKDWKRDEGLDAHAVQTRAQKRKEDKPYRPIKVPSVKDLGSPVDIKTAQGEDDSLKSVWEMAKNGTTKDRSDGGQSRFYVSRGLLFREFKSPISANGHLFKQLVVPTVYRPTVLQLAHESMMAGHMGAKRTLERITTEFFWPGITSDVTRYCRSCDVCQRTYPKGKVGKVPIGSMPLIDIPFHRVAIDIVGPLDPVTERGNRYILTIVDYATRYPEAVPLKGIEAERVAEALVDVYSRVGIPQEVLTDQGAQFTSDLMREVSRLLSIRQLTTTPYHPMCNGLVERFNGTLKQMLRRMCSERPRNWDKYINALLFAYREVTQESLGFSPFELLYGRKVRGPMMILRELWTKDIQDPDIKTTYQYVIDLKERLEETCKMAQQNLKSARARQSIYYNKKAKDRKMNPGQKVLVLLPTKRNKLLMQWKGPYMIEERKGSMDYKVKVDGKSKTYHANLLRLYVDRETGCAVKDVPGVLSVISAMAIEEGDGNGGAFTEDEIVTSPEPTRTETSEDVLISELLSKERRKDVQNLLDEFEDVLTDVPGKTNLGQHDIVTLTEEPVRAKSHNIPYNMKKTIQDEVKKMLKMGVITPSESPYSAPVVIVKKKDGSNRFCIDYRQLNRVTIFDAEPMPNADDIFARLSGHRYFSRLDLSKGYWQVPMAQSAKQKTAFSTPVGLFEFSVMPFGLVNAPATFCRIMRKLLKDMTGIESFIDDILVYTRTWEEHVSVLRALFQRLRGARLTARPTKCAIGYGSLECLGHIVGDQCLAPNPEKIKAILEVPTPETKKQVRSFMGMAGFYRKFIPDFASISVPLTDLTRKGQPHRVQWKEAQERAFITLKKMLSSSPILKLPDIEKEFVLQTDASDYGLGAVLLQEDEGTLFPVAYASRKLKGGETSYAVVEKECLAVIWGILKFQKYLYGRQFTLETDHQPLLYLNKMKGTNARLMRWALQIQPYRFTIRAIRGKDNVSADCLSRL
ncbi:uncharacterized protein LOC117343459 [Pecten maximus]|uniref:uncharacterized protein LOC117343459 n=1 Tax=Pecten maximus TaxID=6579 RepID=UPI00145822F8|nr:uncharacterized protein LOC117343459 [Pecten maximus]